MKSILVILSFLLLTHASFAQDRMDYFVNQALTGSPVLKDYRNQILSSAYDSLLLLMPYKPQFAISSAGTFAPVVKGWGYDEAITNGRTLNALVGVTQQYRDKRTLKAQFENIQLQNMSLNNTSTLTGEELKKNIIAQYITAYAALQQLKFNKDIRSLLSKEEIILKKLTQSNVYRQVDYLSFLVTLQQQELLVKQQSIQYRNELAMLNYMSGLNDTTEVQLHEPVLVLNPMPGMENSLFFKKFEIDSLKLNNSKALADINYRPKFNAFADAGYNSSFAATPYKNFGTSFGVTAVIPLLKGKQKKLDYSKIAISEKTRASNKAFFTRQYTQQVSMLYQQLYATEALIADINKQLKYTQSLIDVNQKLLESGEVKITDYILALNNYITAKNLVAQNTVNRLQIINQLNYWNR